MSGEEIGAQLTIDELREGMVVVLSRIDRPTSATLWVENVSSGFVVFLAGAMEPSLHLMLKRLPDGRMVDDSGTEVRAFEYLGKI